MRAQQQFGKIDQPGALAEGFISCVNLQLLLQVGIIAVFNMRRPPALVLATVDKPLHLLWRPPGFVQLQRLHGTLHQPQLVLGIEYLKPLRQTGFLPVTAQQAVRQTMEGADPHAGNRRLDHFLDAAAHFTGSLVGKGHRENGIR